MITTSIRVVTWNLWARFGPWERRQAAISSTLRALAPDVVCLQEVWQELGGITLAEALADELGMDHVFTTCWTFDGIGVGNAVLSRWAIEDHAELVLPGPADITEPRRLVTLAVTSGPRGAIPVYTTHLAHEYYDSALRQDQTRAIARFVDQTASGRFRPCSPVISTPTPAVTRSGC